jgi:uncharacterized YigZ family protein
MGDSISTVKKGQIFQAEYREKGSRFFAFASHCPDVKQAEGLLQKFRKEYYDATHVCYAFRITEQLFRYSDAGEPSGTAGLPIYNAIEHFRLYKVIVIVVRYFGGTKLGKGGLVRAYYEAAFRALNGAEIIEEIQYSKLFVETDYTFLQILLNEINKFSGKADELEYADLVKGYVQIPVSHVQDFRKAMTNATHGKIILRSQDEPD